MAQGFALSQEMYDRLKEEREYLATVGRAEAEENLRRALELGDPDVNAEYAVARMELDALESRIQQLDNALRCATVSDVAQD